MTNLKPFDLEAALRGEPVVTRDGNKILKICYCQEAVTSCQVIAWHSPNNIKAHFADGRLDIGHENDLDLFMAPDVKKLWIAIVEKSGITISNKFHYQAHSCVEAVFECKDELKNHIINNINRPLTDFIIKEIEIEV